jgi:hypothetical protein
MSKYQTWELTPDEVISGLLVSASTLTLTIAVGVARVGGVLREQTASSTLTASAGATQSVYINPAEDYDGNTLTKISFTPEPDHTHTNLIGGTVGTRKGRSILLATVTTSANSGTVTIAGTPADTETITVTVDGTAVVTTLTALTAASVTTAAAAVAAALNANATVAAKVLATSAAGVVTITAITTGVASAYSLTAAEAMAAGTATASVANLAGATSTVDNTVRAGFGAFTGMRSESGE